MSSRAEGLICRKKRVRTPPRAHTPPRAQTADETFELTVEYEMTSADRELRDVRVCIPIAAVRAAH